MYNPSEVFYPGAQIKLCFLLKPGNYVTINSKVKSFQETSLTLILNQSELQESIPLGSEVILRYKNITNQKQLEFITYVIEHRSINLSRLLLARPTQKHKVSLKGFFKHSKYIPLSN